MATRIVAALILIVVVVYHVLRVMASTCTGTACDWYIPFSLLLPIMAILLSAATVGLAIAEARDHKVWAPIIGVCGVLAAAGPILAAFVLSDNDTKVWVATLLILLVPLAVGIASVWRPSRIS